VSAECYRPESLNVSVEVIVHRESIQSVAQMDWHTKTIAISIDKLALKVSKVATSHLKEHCAFEKLILLTRNKLSSSKNTCTLKWWVLGPFKKNFFGTIQTHSPVIM